MEKGRVECVVSYYDILLAKSLVGGGGGGGAVDDVQINGTSVVTSGVANVPVAGPNSLGTVRVSSTYGMKMYGTNSDVIGVILASNSQIKNGGAGYLMLTPNEQHTSTFYGLAKAAGADMKDISSTTVGIYPETQKSAINSMLSAPESVSGSTPSIPAKAGVRYVCGEVSTLSITTPASGIVDVIFESGSTPTVLTVAPTGGQSSDMKWANGFDPDNLEANTVYEVNILDGIYGVVGQWT